MIENINKVKLVFIINVDWYFKLHWLDRARYFQSLGYEIHIVSYFSDNKIFDEFLSEGMYCYDIGISRKSLNIIREFIMMTKLKKLLSSIDPDIIHCITIKPNIYCGLINRIFLKKPIIFSVTGLGAVFSSRNLRLNFIKHFVIFLYRKISSLNSKFVFENNEDAELFKKHNILSHGNGVVIKGAGIDLTRFKKSQHSPSHDILFAARLLEDKGLRLLVDVCRQLNKEGISVNLRVAGIIDLDVISAIPIIDIEKWHIGGDIDWLGNVEDMPSLIQSSHIVCLPTMYGEGVPRILIEAASCQRPIVTTDVPGCRELVEHNITGLLAKPGDFHSLKNCIKNIIFDDSNAQSLALNAREKVEAEFSQEIVFRKTLAVYNELYSKVS